VTNLSLFVGSRINRRPLRLVNGSLVELPIVAAVTLKTHVVT
jgi:hypothetical protein